MQLIFQFLVIIQFKTLYKDTEINFNNKLIRNLLNMYKTITVLAATTQAATNLVTLADTVPDLSTVASLADVVPTDSTTDGTDVKPTDPVDPPEEEWGPQQPIATSDITMFGLWKQQVFAIAG